MRHMIAGVPRIQHEALEQDEASKPTCVRPCRGNAVDAAVSGLLHDGHGCETQPLVGHDASLSDGGARWDKSELHIPSHGHLQDQCIHSRGRLLEFGAAVSPQFQHSIVCSHSYHELHGLSHHALGGASDGRGEDEVGALAGLEPGGPVLLLLKVHVQLRDSLVGAIGIHRSARWRRRWREHHSWRRWRGGRNARWRGRWRNDPCNIHSRRGFKTLRCQAGRLISMKLNRCTSL